MKQNQMKKLNPKLIKIIAVLTIFLSSFYYAYLPNYSKVLKGLAFLILMISGCIEAIQNKAKKKKNDSLITCVLGIVMWLTNHLEEAVILLWVFQFFEYIKGYKPILKSKTVLIKKKNKEEAIVLSKIKKDMILILNKGDILPVDGSYIEEKTKSKKKFSTKTVDKILSGAKIEKDHIEIKALESYKESKWIQQQEQLQEIYHKIEEKEKDQENIKRKALIIVGTFLILIPNFITQKFEYFSIYLGTVLLLFTIQFSLQNVLKIHKKKIVKNLFLEDIRIKDFESLKKLKNVKNIIFEKTGTLTLGKFRVTSIKTKNEKQFLEYLNYVEYYSHHPIAETIKKYKKIPIDVKKIKDFKETPSRGVACKIDKKQILAGNFYYLKEKGINIKKESVVGTVIYLVVNQTYLGNIVLSDSIKASMKNLTDDLRKFGVKNFSILSGDNEIINKAIGQELKIKDQYSNLTSSEKEFWMQHLMEQRKGKTMLIGNENTSENLIKFADVSLVLEKCEKRNEQSDFTIVNNQLEILPNLFEIFKEYRKKKHEWVMFFIGLRGIWILLTFMESLPLWLPVIVEQSIVLIMDWINRKW